MRRIASVITVLAASVFMSAMPAVSADSGGMYGGQKGLKDECLLVARNCPNETDTIQQRIERLQLEISKGTEVYTPDELNVLNRQLKDAYDNYRALTKPGDGHHPRSMRSR